MLHSLENISADAHGIRGYIDEVNCKLLNVLGNDVMSNNHMYAKFLFRSTLS